MCGICGKVYFDPQRTVTRAELERMSQTLEHRGPDGEGIWTTGHVGLAHRRLAIIDLRAVAGQPMCNEDASIWLTFNGEIYNFQELRADLVDRGHVFRTTSDTEVIVHAYEEYGRDCLQRFRGMFAFALWDSRTRTLFLARDRVGKKPLYYYQGRDRLVFGSEIKALLADPEVPREPDPVALDHYLALQYIPAPLTAFRGIRKLPAAHWLELRDGHVEIGQYWKLRYTPKHTISMRDAIAELQWHLAEAVRLRLISDVPLGAFLSGGIDSSAVVAHMARALDTPVRTFSVGFAEAAFDERPFARMVAERYGTAHTELVVEAPVADILPRLVWHYDEPFGDASAVPSYAIAALTRQHVTVVLNGDGGDENFAGYDRYITDRLLRRGDMVPLSLRRACSALLQRLPESWRQRQPLRKLAKIATLMAQSPARRYARLGGHFTPEGRQSLYTDAFRCAGAEADPEGMFVDVFAQSDAEDWTDTALNADVNLYLADDLLTKMDRATMAHALEARSPFLDHVLMEYVATLPPSFKLSGTQKKRVLKASLRGLLPDTVLDRPKMGFCAPIATWFRKELRDMAYDILLAPRARQRGCFRPQVITRLLDTHCRGEANHAEFLWDLLMLELWQRTFIDGDGYSASIPTRPLTNSTLLSIS
jgi:asparagine synthase (glutamine-hydrolysing)